MSKKETDYSYETELEFSHFGKSGHFTPGGYHYIINSMVDRHLINFNINFEKLLNKNVSWVLLSLTADIINPIKNREQKLIGKTWFAGKKGVSFRRELTIHQEDGTHILSATLYSTLIDLETRNIYRNRELPFDLEMATENILIEAKPTFKEKYEYIKGDTQKVRKSYLDMVGHVNNLRYSDFCFDALSDKEENLENLKRMEIYFTSELKEKEEFSLNKSISDKKIVIQGYNETQDKPSFYGVFTYK